MNVQNLRDIEILQEGGNQPQVKNSCCCCKEKKTKDVAMNVLNKNHSLSISNESLNLMK